MKFKEDTSWGAVVIAGLVFCVVVFGIFFVHNDKPPAEFKKATQEKLAMVIAVFDAPEVALEIRKTQYMYRHVTESEIEQIDASWQEAHEEEPLVQVILGSPLSDTLVAFRELNPEFVEIFVTDMRGTNIAMTNITSDYYQADESWWQKTKDLDGGWAGAVEFDDSAEAWVVPLYGALHNADGDMVGIIKALVDTQKLH